MRSFVGIEIGGTKLQLVVGDERARILDRQRFPVERAEGAEGIRRKIREGLQRFRLHAVSAIGIGFGGPVDHSSGTILTSHQVQGWSDFPLQKWVEELTGIPTWIDNDANVAALGEACYGAGQSHSRIFYVTLGSGVGAGMVIDGSLYHSTRYAEMEFGHVRLDKAGRTVESSCSGWAVDEKVRNYVAEHPGTLLQELVAGVERGEAQVLGTALLRKDTVAREILEGTADDLALGLSHVVHLLNPEIIVLGGGLSLLGDPLRLAVADRLTRYLMHVVQPGPMIQISSLGEDVVPVGALSLAISKLLSA